MKNIPLIAALILCQAALASAQNGALAQLSAMPAAAKAIEAAVALPEAKAAPVAKRAAAVKPAKAIRFNKEDTTGEPAMKMWTALDLVTKFEKIDLHVVNGNTDSMRVEALSCSEDNYAACSMFVTVNGQRKMIVTVDAGAKLIQALAENGFYQEEENWTVGVASVDCRKTGEEYACTIL